MLQQSEEWLKFRKGKLTASKAPIIMGLSPYQSCYELWEEELGFREAREGSEYMKRGLEIENDARDWFFAKMGIFVEPSVEVHPTTPIFIASLDGIDKDKKNILEIKLNNNDFHENVREGKIPEFHRIQMMHQMYVTGLDQCYYISWREYDPILALVERCDETIEQMVTQELQFKYCLDTMTPPPLSERDYVDMSFHEELSQLVWEYDKHRKEAQSHEMLATANLERIKEIAGEKNIKGQNFKITKYMMKGRMNYEAVIEELLPGYNLEVYRKEPKICYRVSVK